MIYSHLILLNLRVQPDPYQGMRSTGGVVEFGCADRSLIFELGTKLENILVILDWVLNAAHELIGRWLHPDGSLVSQIHWDDSIGFTQRDSHKRLFLLLVYAVEDGECSPRE